MVTGIYSDAAGVVSGMMELGTVRDNMAWGSSNKGSDSEEKYFNDFQ